jgi:hypothetical protein
VDWRERTRLIAERHYCAMRTSHTGKVEVLDYV